MGKKKFLFLLGSSALFGHGGRNNAADASGKYMLNALDGMLPLALTASNLGYPDMLLGLPGMQLPIWRWNGKQYKLYKTIADSAAQKLKSTSIEDISKEYTNSLK